MTSGQSAALTTDHASVAISEDSGVELLRKEHPEGFGTEAMTAFVPQCRRESASAYGLRAAGEILSRYLMDEER